jgi:hypothetical protein
MVMAEVVQWLTDHETAVAAFGSLIGAVSTLAIAFLTVFLWLENRALRKAGSEPKVVAHFEIHPNGSGALDIALSNVGTGPARDVQFSFKADEDDFSQYEINHDYSLERSDITLIPQGGKLSFLFAIGFRLYRPKGFKNGDPLRPLKPFVINVRWRSLDRKKSYSEDYVMDISQFNGLSGMFEKPHLLKIADSLDRIDKQIGALKYEARELIAMVDTTTIREDVQHVIPGHPPRPADADN